MSEEPAVKPLKKGSREELEEVLRTLADEYEARERQMNQCPDVYLNVYDMVGVIVAFANVTSSVV